MISCVNMICIVVISHCRNSDWYESLGTNLTCGSTLHSDRPRQSVIYTQGHQLRIICNDDYLTQAAVTVMDKMLQCSKYHIPVLGPTVVVANIVYCVIRMMSHCITKDSIIFACQGLVSRSYDRRKEYHTKAKNDKFMHVYDKILYFLVATVGYDILYYMTSVQWSN